MKQKDIKKTNIKKTMINKGMSFKAITQKFKTNTEIEEFYKKYKIPRYKFR